MKHIDIKQLQKHLVIKGLAGTRKTALLIAIAIQAVSKGMKVLYLTFNKKIRFEVIERSKLSKTKVHTFHSFAYKEIIQTDFLNDIFKDFSVDELTQYFDEDYKYFSSKSSKPKDLSQKTLSELIRWWCDYCENSTQTKYDLIIVDEFQDLNPSMFRMLKKLYMINKKNDVKIIVAGDPYQTIYHYLNGSDSSENYFNTFGKYFGEFETIHLDQCYRCSPAIQRFVNGFYRKQYINYRQFDLNGYQTSDYSEDVFIHLIQHRRLVNEKVSEICNQYQGIKIKILARVNRELSPFSDLIAKNDLIQTSTIHSEKGNECDVVIIVNTIFNDKISSEEDKNLWNVAITRGKKTVHIVSSFPSEKILDLFEAGTYTLISEQHDLSNSTMEDIPQETINLTPDKVRESLIDSVEVQLDYEDAPFIPYEQQNLKKKSRYMTNTRIKGKNIDLVLNQVKGKLNFEYLDLNQLKNQGFTDIQIVSYILETQKEYFNYKISDEELLSQKLRRLDLAKYYEVSGTEILDYLSMVLKLSKYSDSDKKTNYCGEEVKTIYLNSSKAKERGIRIYFPKYKTINSLNTDKNIIKVELYRIRKLGIKKLGLSIKNVGDLLRFIDNNELEKLYDEWMKYEFTSLTGKEVKNIELLKKRRNISSLEDLRDLIDRGNIKIKDKRIYYHILLSFINERERREIEEIVGSKKR